VVDDSRWNAPMSRSNASAALPPKVFYRPIEAAIRWSELTRDEEREVLALANRTDVAQRPEVQLNLDRILDAISNSELPATTNGGAPVDQVLSDLEDLSQVRIRHVDLRAWMTRYYPEHRPTFLFGSLEETLKASVPLDAVNALLIEREALRALVERNGEELRTLRDRRAAAAAALRSTNPATELGMRAEATYLHILGSMLSLMLGETPTGQRYSRFRSQESIITAMVAADGKLLGISERTLEKKFAAARRAVNK
jgi:hypothetical protein